MALLLTGAYVDTVVNMMPAPNLMILRQYDEAEYLNRFQSNLDVNLVTPAARVQGMRHVALQLRIHRKQIAPTCL